MGLRELGGQVLQGHVHFKRVCFQWWALSSLGLVVDAGGGILVPACVPQALLEHCPCSPGAPPDGGLGRFWQ